MQFESLLEIFEDLRNDKNSAWNGCVKNHRLNLAIIKTENGMFFAPINFVAHFINTGSRNKGSDPTGPQFGEIIECLKSQGFKKIIRPADSETEQFSLYKEYYTSLKEPKSSNFESRISNQLVFWEKEKITSIVDHDFPIKDQILKAMDQFDINGTPEGFREAQKWFVAHPDTGTPYPAKIIWGLATSQRGNDFTAHQARDALRKRGFECAALDPSDFAPKAPQTDSLIEGAEYQATRTIRERNSVARKLCIDHYRSKNGGRLACLACDIDFNKVYGELGEGFIHVHHLDPLAEAAGERIVSPKFDLVPVCPNCHAMIHRHGKTRSIEEIVRLLKQNSC